MPVLPEQLDRQVKRTVVSFDVTNEDGVLRSLLTESEVLYRLLSCGDELLVGQGESLRSKWDLAEVINERAEEYQSRR